MTDFIETTTIKGKTNSQSVSQSVKCTTSTNKQLKNKKSTSISQIDHFSICQLTNGQSINQSHKKAYFAIKTEPTTIEKQHSVSEKTTNKNDNSVAQNNISKRHVIDKRE